MYVLWGSFAKITDNYSNATLLFYVFLKHLYILWCMYNRVQAKTSPNLLKYFDCILPEGLKNILV